MEEDSQKTNHRFKNIMNSLSKCKIDYIDEKEEVKTLREVNSKLEVELNEARELEKSHRFHLMSSREMIGSLQETVSQLVYLRRDIKKLKDEIVAKEAALVEVEKDKDKILQKNKETISELRIAHEKQTHELAAVYENKVQQVQLESDAHITQFTCVIEELRSKLKDTENEHRDKMNVVVLEYEEKLQRGAAQVSQLQDQLSRQAARTDANIDAYRRRLEEIEEKLKQSQFKQYLAQSSYTPQYENQVERPYSVNRDPYDSSVDFNPVLEATKPNLTQNKAPAPRPGSTLQVMYYGNKSATAKTAEKKGQFNIVKKRKLYSDKDVLDF